MTNTSIIFSACVLSLFSCVRFFATIWTVAHQAPLSMGFSRQEYWSGLPCFPPRDLPDLGIEPRFKWHPTPVLLPGKSHGRRSLVGYSPWGLKELDAFTFTEQFHFHFPELQPDSLPPELQRKPIMLSTPGKRIIFHEE